MLTSLTIQNVVLIDRLTIDFRAGFCSLTGETGAGKSILLDALGLALGTRAEARLVRKGTDQAQVTATFDILPSHPSLTILHNAGMGAEAGIITETEEAGAGTEVEEGKTIILRRTLGADGRSRAFINDQSVSVGLLRAVGDSLIEIHGQFESRGLLDPKAHPRLLDDYAGVNGEEIRDLWAAWKAAELRLTAERNSLEKARHDEDYLRQAVEDLDALGPEAGEEEKLAAQRERLMKQDQIIAALNVGYDGVNEAETALGPVYRAMERVGDDGANITARLDGAVAELQEVLSAMQALSTDIEEGTDSLETIDDRLFALRGQARKHECSVDDLAAVREKLAGQLNAIERQDDILASLIKEVETLKTGYVTYCEKVSENRKRVAEKLDKLVATELPPLKMERAQFVTKIDALEEEKWGPRGTDRVEFLVATNPGASPGPLGKIASGGEMARFMLALKVVMAETGSAGTMIFDEVDAGVGGATAAAVGARLAQLSQNCQILVVTHAPQVAAGADHHYIVMKSGADDVKTTIIYLEDSGERREEIARMLAGAEITDESRAAAEKLLEGRAA